ncbi:DUF1285 domain-containing protein [Gammaproteobacteria bacterium AS21]|jgi:hypothetical protein
MTHTFDFDKILGDLKANDLPNMDSWQPQLSGDIDIHIDAQGIWRHEGTEFKRLQIPKMFARILCREGDDYFLKTPVEKWRIQVADVPFYFIHLQTKETAQGVEITLVSSTQDIITINGEHGIKLSNDSLTNEPFPYVHVRGGMYGKLSRNLYYELVNMAIVDEQQQALYIDSAGQRFLLGKF